MKGMKTGGRKKGTPNKDNPLKGYLKAHSAEYFMPKQLKQKGKIVNISDFERDMAELSPDDRVNAEIRILEYHTPRMKAIDVLTLTQTSKYTQSKTNYVRFVVKMLKTTMMMSNI